MSIHIERRANDPIFDLIRAHKDVGAKVVEAECAELPTEELLKAEKKIQAKLFKTPPTTLAGARAIVAYLVEFDDGSIPFASWEYLAMLRWSPIFAGEDLSAPALAAGVDAPKAGDSDPVFGVIEAHKKATKLFETAPTTLAGARAMVEYLCQLDADEILNFSTQAYLALPPVHPKIFEDTGGYLRTLLRSPIFAGGEEERA